jgi:hypothetical protein
LTSSIINRLSDHDAQTLEIYTEDLNKKYSIKTRTIRIINKTTINAFKNKLSEELWQDIFENLYMDANSKLNSFLNVYLQIIN